MVFGCCCVGPFMETSCWLYHPDQQEAFTKVNIDQCFMSPDAVYRTSRYLATMIMQANAKAIATMVPKNQIKFPYVWEREMPVDGVVIQVSWPQKKRVVFVPYIANNSGLSIGLEDGSKQTTVCLPGSKPGSSAIELNANKFAVHDVWDMVGRVEAVETSTTDEDSSD
uniref:Uncharacterized protein n=1 Tax=Lotharella globosa TaxID=91324 RepID=A0A7S3YQN7_9EUKA